MPGVDYVDVDVFTGVPASVTPTELTGLAAALAEPRDRGPGAARRRTTRTCTGSPPRTARRSPQVAARYGISLAELLRLNPDITDTRRLAKGRAVFVFRGIRPAQLALLSPHVADTLILTEVTA